MNPNDLIIVGDKVMLKPGVILGGVGEIKPYAVYTIKSIHKAYNGNPFVQLEETPVSYGLDMFQKVQSINASAFENTYKEGYTQECQHEMKTYHGFTESYMYCTKCDYVDRG